MLRDEIEQKVRDEYLKVFGFDPPFNFSTDDGLGDAIKAVDTLQGFVNGGLIRPILRPKTRPEYMEALVVAEAGTAPKTELADNVCEVLQSRFEFQARLEVGAGRSVPDEDLFFTEELDRLKLPRVSSQAFLGSWFGNMDDQPLMREMIAEKLRGRIPSASEVWDWL